jgi:radical SAM protein with 4Fe4S-binding SPASM domain
VHVRPNGDVVPCMYLPAIGNLKREGFQALLGSEASKAALRRVDAADCQRCWMNCYAPHSILSRPLSSLYRACISASQGA